VSVCRPVAYCNLDFDQIMNAVENQTIHMNIDIDGLITYMNMTEKKSINFINFFKMTY